MGPDAMFAITMVLIGPAIVLGSMYLRYRTRQLQHMERIAAIEKGLPLPQSIDDEDNSAGRRQREYRLRGMMWLFSGVALTAGLLAISLGQGRPLSAQEKVWRATDARVRGATEHEIELLLNDPNERSGLGGQMPTGIAFLGLIPAGIGLAYLIFYRMERRNLLS